MEGSHIYWYLSCDKSGTAEQWGKDRLVNVPYEAIVFIMNEIIPLSHTVPSTQHQVGQSPKRDKQNINSERNKENIRNAH